MEGVIEHSYAQPSKLMDVQSGVTLCESGVAPLGGNPVVINRRMSRESYKKLRKESQTRSTLDFARKEVDDPYQALRQSLQSFEEPSQSSPKKERKIVFVSNSGSSGGRKRPFSSTSLNSVRKGEDQ